MEKEAETMAALTNRELYLLRMVVLARMAVCPGTEHKELKEILPKLDFKPEA